MRAISDRAGGQADDGKRPPGVMDVVFGVASRREVFEAKQGEGFRGGEGNIV